MSKIGMSILLISLMLVDFIPNMIKELYAPIAEQLVFGYGVFAFGTMILFLIIIGVGGRLSNSQCP